MNLIKQWLVAVLYCTVFIAQANTSFHTLRLFGENPGQLTASIYSPKHPSAMLVLLHGCTQNAEQLAELSGFLGQAKHHNLALLLPQQAKTNNAAGCFNWFSPVDQSKNSGESLSIVNMINTVKQQYNIKPVYLVGVSAGGAMASNLLVHYPNLFAGAGIIAGIPYPCADNLIKAISCMKSGASISGKALANALTTKNKQWPNLVVITGENDQVVNPENSRQMAEQWLVLKAINTAGHQDIIEGQTRTSWTKDNSTVELIVIKNIGHGIPVNPNIKNAGEPAPFLLKSQFSAAKYLTEKWIK